jgi:phospholipase/carboxylesterase
MNHVFVPGATARAPVVLLHGSGGDEHELIALAADVAPGSPAVGVRGSAPFGNGHAFFHRRPDRTIDEADLVERIPVLAAFLSSVRAEHGLVRPPVAIGFSNGAIMTAALLMTHPRLLAGAILFRPLSPFAEDPPTRLDGKPVLILDGAKDDRRAPEDGAHLADRLRAAGAVVTHRVLPVGHAITPEDRRIALEWMCERE